MKIIAISDLHGYLPENIPEGDLLLICGDIIPLNIQFNGHKSRKWYKEDFKIWAYKQPFNKILFIAGNHDWAIYWDEAIWAKQEFSKADKVTYLQDELYDYKGIKIYGTPWCKQFGHWAFMLNEEGLKEKYSLIPNNIDILMTHDAPHQNGCGFIMEDVEWGHVDASNPQLTEAVIPLNIKYHICGHIHSGNHIMNDVGETEFVNVSLLNEHYDPTYEPLIINISNKPNIEFSQSKPEKITDGTTIQDTEEKSSKCAKSINFLKLELANLFPSDTRTGMIAIAKNHEIYAIDQLRRKFPYNDIDEIRNIVKEYIV